MDGHRPAGNDRTVRFVAYWTGVWTGLAFYLFLPAVWPRGDDDFAYGDQTGAIILGMICLLNATAPGLFFGVAALLIGPRKNGLLMVLASAIPGAAFVAAMHCTKWFR